MRHQFDPERRVVRVENPLGRRPLGIEVEDAGCEVADGGVTTEVRHLTQPFQPVRVTLGREDVRVQPADGIAQSVLEEMAVTVVDLLAVAHFGLGDVEQVQHAAGHVKLMERAVPDHDRARGVDPVQCFPR